MQAFDDFKASFETFKTDLAATLTSAQAKIDVLLANQNDPAVVQGLVDLKAEVEAADASVKDFSSHL